MACGIAIIGAGLAGVSAAEELRAHGYGGVIRLFDDEGEPPYDRPPLSKQFAAGTLDASALRLRPQAWYAEHGIDLLQTVAVTDIEPAGHRLTTSDGAQHGYDSLLLTTGARARCLPGVNAAHDNVLMLRSLRDARRLQARMQPGARILLIGGGVIGMETAATAAQAGCTVRVLEAGARIMARFFPPMVSEYLAGRHRAAGVEIRTSFAAERIEPHGHGVSVWSDAGEQIDGDLIVVGIGSAPDVVLATRAGLATAAGGIAVDRCGRTSAADIYAAGDCAAFPGETGPHIRWENWTHAVLHAQHAARAMLGQALPYAAVPWVWSDQYDMNIQVTGEAVTEHTVLRGDPAAGKFTLLHLQSGVIVGGTTVNNGRDKRPLARLVAAHVEIDMALLADPAVPLATFVPQAVQ